MRKVIRLNLKKEQMTYLTLLLRQESSDILCRGPVEILENVNDIYLQLIAEG